jgi:hypothetical protein
MTARRICVPCAADAMTIRIIEEVKPAMGRRHGRAVMPWGKYRGVRLRLLPDSYLSWLTTSRVMTDPRWNWLKDSLTAELEFRGFQLQGAQLPDAAVVKDAVLAKFGVRKLRGS